MFWQHRHESSPHHPDHPHHHECNRGGRGRHGPRGRAGSAFEAAGAAWGSAFGGEPPRADRGAVRYLVLDAVASQPRHGYDIITVIEQRSKGTYRPSPGVVYPTLQMLDDMGHVKAVDLEGRKAYEITAEGSKDLTANRDAVDDFYERAGDNPWERFAEDFGDIRHRLVALMKTFKRAARRGQLSSGALAKIKTVLDEAVGKIEAIFAGEDSDKG